MPVSDEAWAAGEAAIMRAMVVHGLLLTRRATGSRPLGYYNDKDARTIYMSHNLPAQICQLRRSAKMQIIKDLIWQVLGGCPLEIQ